jgi:hypothetical protein
MKNAQAWLSIMLILLLPACAGSQAHRFLHPYSVPQALRFVRQAFQDQDYQIAIFDIPAGVIKTEKRDLILSDGDVVRYQISAAVIKSDEFMIKIIPNVTPEYRRQIMTPLIEAFNAMGIVLKQDPILPSP